MGKATKWLLLAKKAFSPSKRRPREKAELPVESVDLKSNGVKAQILELQQENELLQAPEAAEEIDEVRSNVPSDEEDPFPVTPAPSSTTTHEGKQVAAVKIQTAYRVFQARKQLKALKGLSRLQSIIHGKATKKQTLSAMRNMQSFTKMQSQVRVQRSRMTELEQQRKLELEKEKPECERFCVSPENWDDSRLSKEQIKAKMESKRSAAIKRERTLAYAFSNQQWRSYPKDLTLATDGDEVAKPSWSWSWLEQWMFTRDWENLHDGGKSPPNGSKIASSISPTSTGKPIFASSKKASPSRSSPPNVASPTKVSPPKLASPTVSTSPPKPAVPPTSSSPKVVPPKVLKSRKASLSPAKDKLSPSGNLSYQLSSPKSSSQVPSPKVATASSPSKVGSPLRKISPRKGSPNRSPLRKPTPIQSISKPSRALNGDENQPQASPSPGRTKLSNVNPSTPERGNHAPVITKSNFLRKHSSAANGRVSPAMSPKVQK